MSASPDLSLPPKAPIDSHEERCLCDHAAVYTLVALGTNGLDGLLKALSHNDDELYRHVCALLPKHNFCDAPLKDVYDYHLQLETEKGTFNPTLFIVAQYQDYEKNGVLLVNLDTDLKGTVDTCRMKASEAASAVMNLEIANMDWEDYKENEYKMLGLPPPSAGASETGNALSSNQTGAQQPPDQSSSASPHAFGVYTTAGANMTAICSQLEPDWLKSRPRCGCAMSSAAICIYTSLIRGRG
jgi:hypothetical protein